MSKITISTLVVVFVILLVLAIGLRKPEPIVAQSIKAVKIGEHTYQVELADTMAKRIQGLSGRESLAPGQGMLFIFDHAAIQSFWMKGMNFPIDIIWIAPDKRVAGFAENVEPEESSFPTQYRSPVAVDLVLEVNAGTVQRDNIKQGDIIELIKE